MPTLVQSSPLLSRVQAAEYLGLRPGTLAIWAMSSKHGLRVIKVGKLAKYRKSDLDAWLESRTVGAVK
jgi:excisionase family DNA binding protein